jgi:hypothetical protein
MNAIVILYPMRPALWYGASVEDVMRVEGAIRGWTTDHLIRQLMERLSEPQPD